MLFAMLAAVALGAGPGAAASPPTPASGTFTYLSSTFDSMRSAGGNTIIDLSATVSYTGTFSGTSTLHGILIFHSDGTGAQFPPWRANFHDVETFTGTVNGVSGTVTFNLNGSNDPTGVASMACSARSERCQPPVDLWAPTPDRSNSAAPDDLKSQESAGPHTGPFLQIRLEA
ncbi:MAG: hypothetical protein E6G36_03260 [Actinobacteria bacterium]|nr:MAG: hypothetical protein E6G36_03260 [Actinomycetota bacterium]